MKDNQIFELEQQIRQLKQFYNRPPQERFLKIAKSRLVNRIVLASMQQKPKTSFFIIGQLAGGMVAAVLIFILASGFLGIIKVAQGALPGEPLYQFKLFSEDLIVAITGDDQIKLLRRANEIVILSEKGEDEDRLEAASENYINAVEETKKESETSVQQQGFKKILENQEQEFKQVVKNKPSLGPKLKAVIEATQKGQNGKVEGIKDNPNQNENKNEKEKSQNDSQQKQNNPNTNRR